MDADAGSELDAPAGEVVEHRDVLGEAHRMMEGQLPDHRSEAERLGVPGDGGEEYLRGGYGTDVGALMLQRPVVAEPDALHQLRLPDVRLVDLGGGGRAERLVGLHLIPRAELDSRHSQRLRARI